MRTRVREISECFVCAEAFSNDAISRVAGLSKQRLLLVSYSVGTSSIFVRTRDRGFMRAGTAFQPSGSRILISNSPSHLNWALGRRRLAPNVTRCLGAQPMGMISTLANDSFFGSWTRHTLGGSLARRDVLRRTRRRPQTYSARPTASVVSCE